MRFRTKDEIEKHLTSQRSSGMSIAAYCRQDPLSGHLFVFLNRGRNRIKGLFWDRSGYCLYYKRLEAGTFVVPGHGGPDMAAAMSVPDLMMILEGINLSHARRRKRFSLEKS
jgi:transposase